MRAASLNFLDIAVAVGAYPVPALSMVPVADRAGEIAELGEGVDSWAVGDRVVPHFMPHWQDGTMTPAVFAARRAVTRPGSLAEYVVAPAVSLVVMPDHLTFAEAATLPIAATGPRPTIELLPIMEKELRISPPAAATLARSRSTSAKPDFACPNVNTSLSTSESSSPLTP